MSKFIQANLNNLNKLKERTTGDVNKTTKKRVDEIIKLYGDRKISLTSKNKKNLRQSFYQIQRANKRLEEEGETLERKNGRDQREE